MRVFKVVVYTTGSDFETKEYYVNEPKFRQYQKDNYSNCFFLPIKPEILKRRHQAILAMLSVVKCPASN